EADLPRGFEVDHYCHLSASTSMVGEWQCKQCKQYNPDEEESCDQCLAPRVADRGPRETCRTCSHRHSTGKSCHVFVADKKSRESKAK
ncbi:unnamed protein product, partial [Laminaria digitata]